MRLKKEDKLALVEECRASGMTAKTWCEAKGIDYRRYLTWATKANEKAHNKGPQWADITQIKEELPNGEIKLICGKWTIGVGSGFNPSLLTEVLKVVNVIC